MDWLFARSLDIKLGGSGLIDKPISAFWLVVREPSESLEEEEFSSDRNSIFASEVLAIAMAAHIVSHTHHDRIGRRNHLQPECL